MERIGPYRIVDSIGQGSTSHVYKCHDEALNRFVAVKTITGVALSDETVRLRFEREAQAAAGLSHPNIVTVYDFGRQSGSHYLAMELLEGCDLKQALVDGQLGSLEARLDVMAQIAEGLGFAHGQRIVHRDLKPANIRLLPSGQVKILDFGLARVGGSDMTRTGLVIGTPHYMAPEQVRGEHVDARCDVFALGCLLYEVTTGARPFEADSLHAVFYKVLQSESVPAREVVRDLPPVIEEIIDKALAKTPADPFADASEFGRFLAQAREAIANGRGHESLAGLTPPTRSATAPPRAAPRPAGSPALAAPRRRRHLLRLVAVLAPLLVAAGWFLVRRPVPAVGPPARDGDPDRAGRDLLARDIVDTRVALARRRLEAGDYAGAVREAESALSFDPQSAPANETLPKARQALARIDRAVADARAGVASRDPGRAAQAFWELLKLAPQHEVAVELASALDAGFQERAEEARRAMKEARLSAEARQAGLLDSFRQGAAAADAGDAAFKLDRFASAAREFMKARASFERARPPSR